MGILRLGSHLRSRTSWTAVFIRKTYFLGISLPIECNNKRSWAAFIYRLPERQFFFSAVLLFFWTQVCFIDQNDEYFKARNPPPSTGFLNSCFHPEDVFLRTWVYPIDRQNEGYFKARKPPPFTNFLNSSFHPENVQWTKPEPHYQPLEVHGRILCPPPPFTSKTNQSPAQLIPHRNATTNLRFI